MSLPAPRSAPDPREAMRATLLAHGFTAADIDGMLGAPRPATDTVRGAVTDAVAAMRRELPRSVKTWVPYLQVLTEGLPDLCPCSCTACATGFCPCSTGVHAETCQPPADHADLDCGDRYRGVADMDITAVTRQTVAEGAWWVQRRGLKRTVARNAARLAQGDSCCTPTGAAPMSSSSRPAGGCSPGWSMRTAPRPTPC